MRSILASIVLFLFRHLTTTSTTTEVAAFALGGIGSPEIARSVTRTERQSTQRNPTEQLGGTPGKAEASSATSTPTESDTSMTVLKSYQYDGWNLTYRFRPASPGYENDPPILLVHPVGVGMTSAFWERTMNALDEGPAMLAPNLIGCGVSEGSDAWNPDERGLFIPLDWVRGCEALMEQYVDGSAGGGNGSCGFPWKSLLRNKTWTVVAQGGLAPIGVLLAARNPKTVRQLVLASPPTWKDMTTAIPEQELARNYNFLRNPIWGNLAFQVLETSWAIRFFSNLFLFSEPCDDDWIESAKKERSVEARPPVQCFNAGMCLNKSLEAELTSLQKPTLIVEGVDDKRERIEYTKKMKNASIQPNKGTNVIPWEFPDEFAKVLAEIAR